MLNFLKTLNYAALAILVVPSAWLVLWLWVWLAVPDPARDDSDPFGGRSGMMVLTDSLTGCQYLYRGSLTPRMDRNGKQVCQ